MVNIENVTRFTWKEITVPKWQHKLGALFTSFLLALLGLGAVLAVPAEAQAKPIIKTVHFVLVCSTNDIGTGCLAPGPGKPPADSITVYVFGSGFGKFNTGALPYSGDSNDFIVQDITAGWNAGNTVANLCEPQTSCAGGSAITGDYEVWTNTEVEVSFNPAGYGWTVGDAAYVGIENPQSSETTAWKGKLTTYVGPATHAVPNLTVGGFKTVSVVLPTSNAYTRMQFAAVTTNRLASYVNSGGHVVAALGPLSLTQVGSLQGPAIGSVLRYTITPTNNFIHASPSVQVTDASEAIKSCQAYLSALVNRYVSDLYAARVPWNRLGGLGTWWQVVLQVHTTTGATFSFVITESIGSVTSSSAQGSFQWAVGSKPVPTQAALAQSLAHQLYYSQAIAQG